MSDQCANKIRLTEVAAAGIAAATRLREERDDYHHYWCGQCASFHTGHGYDDLTLTCVDCHRPFVFNGGERTYYAGKGFPNPKSCPSCRWLNSIIREERRAREKAA